MKKFLIAASLLAACVAASAQNVSISVGQPGFYGRIDIGNMAPPPVIYTEPVLVRRPARFVEAPLYLRVPPGHAKKWSKHCGAYNACGRKVYFVRDDWYQNDYAPRYRAEHHRGRQEVRHEMRHDDRRDDHRDKHERKHDKHEDKHHGNGHGKGHGKD
ncbi:hypothetical protein [Pseudoduganella namucuonensis]|uniref:DUF3300 domain-containing protein n=1 Tax=Pseudoduganella namucuonensis TaxID=1035707 RepID=A0A1I7GVQ6_9BURK|nr:hypothetical protein [Pseudoduganella namucuonensis]SFU52534.1 hypothetical protein SAMN05216552_1004148 [Pseudoduganella namucuonensis]